MIRLFRKIRQNLLREGKTTQYIKYALGEIILVVLGILIALQINGWKIAADNRKLEESTLLLIKNDLQDDISELRIVTEFKSAQIASCRRILELMVTPSLNITDTAKFENDVVNTIYFNLPSIHKTAFETAKGNGYLNSNTNGKLAADLSEYYTNISLDQHLTETKRFTNNYAEAALFKKFMIFSENIAALDGMGGSYRLEHYKNVFRHGFSFEDFRKDPEIENLLNSFYIRLNIGVNYLKIKERNAASLIQQIDEHLNEF